MEKKEQSAHYETIFIVRPEEGGKVKEFLEKFKKVVEDFGATMIDVEEWGVRELAYPIKKRTKGYYNLMRYRGPMAAVEELERNLKLSEAVMRSLSVRVDPKPETAPPTEKPTPEPTPETTPEPTPETP